MVENMKIRPYITLVVLAFAFGIAALTVAAQTPPSAEAKPTPAANEQQPDNKINFLAQLGLSREQIQQIRRLNAERHPLMVAAQMRLRAANRALDEAIYSDSLSEADVDARTKEAQEAQAEVVRIRSMSEFSIRKILTPEQLARFRELRAQFEEVRKNVDMRRRRNAGNGQGRPAPANGFQQPGQAKPQP
jgi:Spy/CpxP family protein refolding chaperone